VEECKPLKLGVQRFLSESMDPPPVETVKIAMVGWCKLNPYWSLEV